MSDQDDELPTPVKADVAAAIVDIFVYVVVLNLFVEYLPRVISEGFTLSLLTAVLLKGVLEVDVMAKNRAKRRFRVLEAVDLVFGSRVNLGGFFSVTLLILVLLLSRAGVRRLLQPGRLQRTTV